MDFEQAELEQVIEILESANSWNWEEQTEKALKILNRLTNKE